MTVRLNSEVVPFLKPENLIGLSLLHTKMDQIYDIMITYGVIYYFHYSRTLSTIELCV